MGFLFSQMDSKNHKYTSMVVKSAICLQQCHFQFWLIKNSMIDFIIGVVKINEIEVEDVHFQGLETKLKKM